MSIALVSDHTAAEDRAARDQSPLSVRGLTVSYDSTPALFSVDITVRVGAMTAIVGPNGAGKSSLLKAALGVVKPLAGSVSIFGKPLAQMRDQIAYVPQRASVDWDFPTRVIDVVMMGMYRRLGLLGRVRGTHKASAMTCLERVGMTAFAHRQIGQLSGGQQQRVFLARALAQEAQVYLLDEPFAGVDAATEAAIVTVLQSLRDDGCTVLVVHHDLTTVTAYFDQVILLNREVIAAGPVNSAFSHENLQQTYGGRLDKAQIGPDRANG